MRNASQTLPLGKPVRVTVLPIGSANFFPETVGNLAFIEMVGAGGGGGRSANGSGISASAGAGAVDLSWFQTLDQASYPYIVPAGGVGATAANTAGAAGGYAYFAPRYAPGGGAGQPSSTTPSPGGRLGWLDGVPDADNLARLASIGFLGIPGGFGGGGSNTGAGIPRYGASPGYAVPPLAGMGTYPSYMVSGAPGADAGGYTGGGGGGGSTRGTGGNGGAGHSTLASAGANATGYGAGGGGGGTSGGTSGNGGNGSPGYIRITEWRAA